ncbi:MAG: hypothetical protein RMJ75_06330 [Nitrososphaerota archaeon]|nr:hypothetical protein [Nitrososphaerota archaeon]
MDGVLSPGEYGSCIGPVTPPYVFGGTSYTIVFCEMNDGRNDYYYFQINDLTQDGNDRFYLLFDNAHDGVVAACGPGIPVEDAIGYIEPPPRPLPTPLIDMHYCGQPTTDQPPASVDGSQHITSVHSFTPGVGYRFEFSHPMNSGDPQDYSLSIGSTVGWCIYWRDASKPSPNILQYPPDCYSVYATGGGASLYGHVIKVGEQPPTGTTVTTTTTRTVTTTDLITTTLTATRTTTAVITSISVTTTTVTRPPNATPTVTLTTTIVSPTTVTTRGETTLTTTATLTTTRTTETVSTVTSMTTRTLETTTTATTTSIVVDPMLENKLYVVIALLLAIIGLIFWLYWNCCKKKGPFPPTGGQDRRDPVIRDIVGEGKVRPVKSGTDDHNLSPSPPTQPQQATTVRSTKSNSDNRSGLGEGADGQKVDDVATEGLRSKSVSHKRRFRVVVDWQTSSLTGQARQALNDALQGLDAVSRDISEISPSQKETALRNWNNSKANLYRLGQMLTGPTAQQEVGEALRCLDESYQQWEKGNKDGAIKLLDKAAEHVRRAGRGEGPSGIAVTDPGVPNE